ncbi:MAG: hypothetical protein ABSB01_06495 [Streptosporangiaceae bacterium]
MENKYSGLVTGPAAMFPRGYLLLIPVWYAVVAGLLVVKGRLPFWYTAIALGALLLAMLILAGVLATMRQKAFFVDVNGVWLGKVVRWKRSRRRRVLVPWSQIGQLRIASRHYGAQLEVVLGPAASIIHRHRLVSGIFFAGVTVIIPPRWIGRPPALLSARAKPLRYVVPLYATAEGLGSALAAIAPPTVQVTVAAD